MSLPRPEPGLVVWYAYLWLQEHLSGREEGAKDRPCAIILATQVDGDGHRVIVVPITHRPPDNPAAAVELPPAVKEHLRLDDARSWVVVSESNEFRWPGPDLRPAGDRGQTDFAFGFLPPRLFAEIKRRFIACEHDARSKRIRRTE